MKFENIDLVDALRRIMDIHTQNYKRTLSWTPGCFTALPVPNPRGQAPSLDVPSERHLPPA